MFIFEIAMLNGYSGIWTRNFGLCLPSLLVGQTMTRQSWTGFLHTSTGQMCRSSARFQLQVTMAKILAYMKLIYNDYSKSITSNHHKDNRGCDVTAFWKEVVLLIHVLGLKFGGPLSFQIAAFLLRNFQNFPKLNPLRGWTLWGRTTRAIGGTPGRPLPYEHVWTQDS